MIDVTYKVVITTPNMLNPMAPNQRVERFTSRPDANAYIREPGNVKDRAKVSLIEVKEKVLERYDAEATSTIKLRKQKTVRSAAEVKL